MTHLLLCTDLDRTLIPNGTLPVSISAKKCFEKLTCHEDITLVYVSGRNRALIEQAITEFDLPTPHFALADVGSTIYQIEANNWQRYEAWDKRIAPDWLDKSSHDLHSLFNIFPTLQLQEAENQNRHKMSYYLPINMDTHQLTTKIKAQLTLSGIKANLIWSIDEAKQVGLLDVLPAHANKLKAIQFLMEKQSFYIENTIFAGDSGNDLDVLLSDIPSILVANATINTKAQLSTAQSLYIAKGGYLNMNGNYSAGIIEGVAHYWPQMKAWLRETN
ncbi:MAG: HAD-IIB family hydrolase [Gallionella sp.]